MVGRTEDWAWDDGAANHSEGGLHEVQVSASQAKVKEINVKRISSPVNGIWGTNKIRDYQNWLIKNQKKYWYYKWTTPNY